MPARETQQGALDGLDPPREAPSRRLARLRALVAPVARDGGSVIDDPELLEVARAVCDAFVQGDAAGGLTRAQIIDRVAARVDRDALEARLAVFEKLGFLRTYLDKLHQQRYTIEPTSLVGQEVFERIGERGGVDELLALLVRTRSLLDHQPDETEVLKHLREIRGILSAYANELGRLVATAPLRELLAERSDHDQANALQDLQPLAEAVTERFPDLRTTAADVVEEAQRYLTAVQAMMARILDEGGTSRDFSVLSPDDYLSAAIQAPVDVLAEVFATVVFDPPSAWIGAAEIDAASGPRSRHQRTRRPPEPLPSSADDPLGSLLAAAHDTTLRRALAAERLLQGEASRDLTSNVQGLAWPAAARLLADLLAVDLDPRQPFELTISEATFVDPQGPVTYLSPVTLARQPRAAAPVDATHEPAAPEEAHRG